MNNLEFVKFEYITPEAFLPILNKLKLREHLIDHEMFDFNSAKDWINSKVTVDSTIGCKVRGVTVSDNLVGWCGIQLENNQYEIAIVIDDSVWGLGIKIFHELMSWADKLGHHEVYIHFLHTRNKYKFLNKISKRVFDTEMYGNKFTTYELTVFSPNQSFQQDK